MHLVQTAMGNHERRGILQIVELSSATLEMFLVGVLARAQTRTGARVPPAAKAARVTIQSTVARVSRHVCSGAALRPENADIYSPSCATTSVLLNVKGGFVNVRPGLSKFIRDNQFFFVQGDPLIVIGFPAADHGRATVVSEEVIKSNRVLVLCDPHGHPLWVKKAKSVTAPAILAAHTHAESRNRTLMLSRTPGKTIAVNL